VFRIFIHHIGEQLMHTSKLMSANALYVPTLGLKQNMRLLANIVLQRVLNATDIKLGYSNILHNFHDTLTVFETK
jgi:hypothetical protein